MKRKLMYIGKTLLEVILLLVVFNYFGIDGVFILAVLFSIVLNTYKYFLSGKTVYFLSEKELVNKQFETFDETKLMKVK